MPSLVIPELETDRLVLTPLSRDDSEGMYALWSRPEVCEHAGTAVDSTGAVIVLPARSAADSDRILDYWLWRRADGSGFRWAMRRQGDGDFVGALGFNALGAFPELAYHLHPGCWGKGLMREAAQSALQWCFAAEKRTAVFASIARENERSARLAARLGFRLKARGADGVDRYVLSEAAWRRTVRTGSPAP